MKTCADYLEIEVGNDYDYHDAPPSIEIHCDRTSGHMGLHAAYVPVPFRRNEKRRRVTWGAAK